MKPAPFELHRPETAADAVSLMQQLPDAKLLAGGQSLIPMLALRLASFEHLIDLSLVDELVGVSTADGSTHIGAMTRQSTLERDSAAGAAAPLIRMAVRHIGHPPIRNRGTIGGSLAHADPAAELPATALALDAQLRVLGPQGERSIVADEFFETVWTTALDDTELLTGVSFPSPTDTSRFGMSEIARRHGDFALAGCVVALDINDDNEIRMARVALFGVADRPVRARETEHLLVGRSAAEPVEDAVTASTTGLTPGSDIHASAAYRLNVIPVLVRRTLRRAIVGTDVHHRDTDRRRAHR